MKHREGRKGGGLAAVGTGFKGILMRSCKSWRRGETSDGGGVHATAPDAASSHLSFQVGQTPVAQAEKRQKANRLKKKSVSHWDISLSLFIFSVSEKH